MDTPSKNPATDSPDQGPKTVAPDRQARRHGGFGTPLPRWVRIVIASVMLATAGATLLTRDLLVRWDTQTRLQVDATRMAIAGAVFLPGAPARAMMAAAHSASLCGVGRLEVVQAGATSDRMSFEVKLRRTAPLLLLRVLGLAGVNVTATATAHRLPPRRKADGPTVLLGLCPYATPPDFPDAASAWRASDNTAINRSSIL